jgi:DNA polymerase I-like protein with 3'-5' exonuclease and polymerase domains
MRNITSTTVLDLDHLHATVDYFLEQEAFAFDVETTGDLRGVPMQNEVVWMGIATAGMTKVIPFGHPNGNVLISRATRKKNKFTGKFDNIPAQYSEPPDQLRPSVVFSALKPLFFSDRVKIAHNATFDLISTAKYFGEIPPPEYSDTIVLQWLLDENLRQKGLKPLVNRYWGVDYDTENVGKKIEAHPFWKVARYQFLDAKFTWLLWKRLNAQVEAEGLARVRDLEMDVLGVLLDMGTTGARVDVAALQALDTDLQARLVEIEGEIYRLAGQRFNLNAPAQKAKVLFAPKAEGGQGLRASVLTDGGEKKAKAHRDLDYGDYSTAAAVLEGLAHNPVARTLLQYADVAKISGTYVQGYLGVPDNPDKPCRIWDETVYADFVQYGTVTGRFSCREPNLQNIPRPDSDLGKRIRGLFIAPEGHRLVVADYGQIELALLAHFIREGRLFDGFWDGIDPHSATAAALVSMDPREFQAKVLDADDWAKRLRQAAKGINFAIVYGAGPDKVASMAEISVEQAQKFLDIHERMFPEVYRFKSRVIEVCRSRRPPHVVTLLGRRRRLPEMWAKEVKIRRKAERQAVNSLIQGSAADLIKLAMIRLNKALEEGMHLSLSVHDELVTVAREDVADRCAEIVREAMLGEGIQRLVRVPLSSDVKIVQRWSEAK